MVIIISSTSLDSTYISLVAHADQRYRSFGSPSQPIRHSYVPLKGQSSF